MKNRFATSAILSCALFLSACGGGGADAPTTPAPGPGTPPPPGSGNPPPPPLAAPIWSADAAVTRTNVPSATFAVKLDVSTVTATSVQVVGPEGNVIPGSPMLSLDGKTITWKPLAGAIPGGSTYDITLSLGIQDTRGSAMDHAVARKFVVAPQQWAPASTILGAIPYFTSGVITRLASDQAGNVSAIWSYRVPPAERIFASRLNKASGLWSAPQTLNPGSQSSIGGVSAVAAPNGDVFVSWADYASSPQSLLMARYVASSGAWDQPVAFSKLPQGIAAGNAWMDIDGKGTITAVFKTWAGNALYAARYEPSSKTWGDAFRIDPPHPDNYFSNVDVQADAAGNVTVAWVQSSPSNSGLNVRRYSAATSSWSESRLIEENIAPQSFSMASDAQGGASLVWTHGARMVDMPYIAASVFDPATSSWSTPAMVSTAGPNLALAAGYPAVVRSNSGASTVVWRQDNAVYGARLSGTSAWTTPYRIDDLPQATAAFTLGVDSAGNVTAAYSRDPEVVVSRYSASSQGWELPVLLGAPPGVTLVSANQAGIVVDPAGDVSIAWQGQTLKENQTSPVILGNRFN